MRLLLALVLLSLPAAAAPRPRVALPPVAAASGQLASVPAAATSALLADAASRPVEFPSSFEVDDALATLKQEACVEADACLGALAKVTRAGWAVGVVARLVDGGWQLTGRVVSDEGVLVRPPRTLPVKAAPVGFDWPGAAAALLDALSLPELLVDDELKPLSLAPAPPKPAPAAVTTAPAPKPAPALTEPGRPARDWRSPTAAVLGGAALAAGGAALTLALVNLREAALLRATTGPSGSIPAAQLERAASLDERTLAATGLGIGAAVVAGAALTFWLSAPADAPRAAVAVTPGGAAVVVTGSWP